MLKSRVDLEAVRFGVAGVLAGIGLSLLICMFIEFLMDNVRIPEDMPGDCFYVISGFAPLIAMGITVFAVARAWSEETPARRNELLLNFLASFGIPFMGTYLFTWAGSWILRVA